MKLVLLDRNGSALQKLYSELETPCQTLVGDITDSQVLKRLVEIAYDNFGQVNLLFNNVGIGCQTSPWTNLDNWKLTMAVNLFSMIDIQSLFIPKMLEQKTPSAIVNLGSKEGITTPPGNAAYSVSKASVKVLTEQLAYELRNREEDQVSAHLLVPGYTWPPMNFKDADFNDKTSKPAEPWYPEQVIEALEKGLLNDQFYIICLDNEVTKEMDDRRMHWAMYDIIENRPALSRWHPDYKEEFEKYLNH